tara:strand:+ start:4461 stop:5522 length:1062 start_codon:yes stop_codon:yes gene_type:complete
MNNFLLDSDLGEIINNLGNEIDSFSGKTVLLTGGRGFLGRYFTSFFDKINRECLKKPSKIIILDNLITAGKEGKRIPNYKNITFKNHNVIEPYDINHPIDYIIHAAGIASPHYYRAYPLETLDVSIAGTKNFLELAKSAKSKFVFFSSSEIYGDPDPQKLPISEDYRGSVSCQGPRACYDESKRLGETLCYIYNNLYGIHTNTIRPFNVYGPGMQEKDYRVLPNFASLIKGEKPLTVYGSGNQTRTFCYITDAITGFLKVVLKGVSGEPYNIGNPQPEISVLDLVEIMKKVSDKKVSYKIIDYPDSYPADEPNRRVPNIDKAKLDLNYSPKVDLETGLDRFLKWTDRTYIGEN